MESSVIFTYPFSNYYWFPLKFNFHSMETGIDWENVSMKNFEAFSIKYT